MDIGATHTLMQHLLSHYGPAALFALLAVGIVGLPIPDETLLVFAGMLMAKGEMSIVFTILSAIVGSIFGITISFVIGSKLGRPVIIRYGKVIGISDKKLDLAHDWFEKRGKWLLTVGYFIPGVRHLVGIVAGISKLEYRVFALFAYAGAIIWSSCFLTVGYFFLSGWQHWHF